MFLEMKTNMFIDVRDENNYPNNTEITTLHMYTKQNAH